MKAITISHEGRIDTVEIGSLTGRSIKSAIGATGFRVIDVPDPHGGVAFIPEPGEGQPFNWVATTWLRPSLHPSDRVNGNVLVTGPSDVDGHPTDVGDGVMDALGRVTDSMHALGVTEHPGVVEA